MCMCNTYTMPDFHFKIMHILKMQILRYTWILYHSGSKATDKNLKWRTLRRKSLYWQFLKRQHKYQSLYKAETHQWYISINDGPEDLHPLSHSLVIHQLEWQCILQKGKKHRYEILLFFAKGRSKTKKVTYSNCISLGTIWIGISEQT